MRRERKWAALVGLLFAIVLLKEAHATNQYVDQCQDGPQTADCCIRQGWDVYQCYCNSCWVDCHPTGRVVGSVGDDCDCNVPACGTGIIVASVFVFSTGVVLLFLGVALAIFYGLHLHLWFKSGKRDEN